jgi:xylulokinase
VARLIGLDVGTTGLKGVAVSDDGRVQARAAEAYPFASPRPGWTEQDPELWWQACLRVQERLGDGDAIGLSGQMHGLVLLDAGLHPIRPAILWNDGRTAAQCAEIEAALGRAELVALTGNRALTGFTAPKLLWVREHEPENFARVRHVLLPKDYVRLRLTGELATDVSDASGTLLFDVARRTWSERVLAALEIPPEWLPPALESPDAAGRTPAGVPVAAGAGDQAAGAIGVGVDRPGPASVALGTSGVVFSALAAYRPDPEARVHTFCHARPQTWHAMGVMLSAAGSLRWLRDAAAPGVEFSALVEEAERWPPGVGGLRFLPYLSGERTPHADPDVRGAFVGLGLEHDRGALARATLEGVAYGLRDALELLAAVGPRPALGRVSGGGARSALWLRIIASVLGLPLEHTEADEGAAYGAALLGGVAGGVFPDVETAIARCVRPVGRVEPDPGWAEAYEAGYAWFQAAYPLLKRLERRPLA